MKGLLETFKKHNFKYTKIIYITITDSTTIFIFSIDKNTCFIMDIVIRSTKNNVQLGDCMTCVNLPMFTFTSDVI